MKSSASAQVGSRYAVIVDAGSSGSRVFVYSWPDPNEYRDFLDRTSRHDDLEAVPPVEFDKAWTKKTVPGISKFGGSKLSRLWNGHLKALMNHASSIVPPEEHYRTPVFVLATAGMRLLPEAEQKRILERTCQLLQDNTQFYLPECSTHVAVIDGETEGLYGWMALNYLVGSGTIFNEPENSKSYGFMDMGGASAQIAFSPNSTEAERHWDDLFHLNLRTVNGHSHEWKIFVSTWLGFGANEARRRYLDSLIEVSGSIESGKSLKDPCLPVGAQLDHESTVHNGTFHFEGVGQFSSCQQAMFPLLQKDLPCKDEPCLFNGVHVPAIDYDQNRFVGVSEYWYTANDVLKLGGKYDFAIFSQKTKEYCERRWSGILREAEVGSYKDIPVNILESACFKASWVINILHEGFGVPVETKSNRKRELDGDESTEEVLQMETYNNNSSDVLSKRNLHDFLDPFQSAIDINGQELSWTLGRAVLYASSQIDPAAPDIPAVGYMPASGSGKSFVAGGELDHVVPPMFVGNMASSGWGGIYFLFIAFLACSLFVGWAVRMGVTRKLVYNGAVLRLRSLQRKILQRLGRAPSDEVASQLLMEEGGAGEESVQLEDYRSSPIGTPYSRQSLTSIASLGTSTSMLDIKGQVPPSRVNSRLGMRTPGGPGSPRPTFGFGDDGDTERESRHKDLHRVKSHPIL